jgi:hypothetical protein
MESENRLVSIGVKSVESEHARQRRNPSKPYASRGFGCGEGLVLLAKKFVKKHIKKTLDKRRAARYTGCANR